MQVCSRCPPPLYRREEAADTTVFHALPKKNSSCILQTAVEKAAKLPDQQQDDIAALMVNAIARKAGERPLGLAKGMVQVPDDFNDPLPEEELVAWYGDHSDDPLTQAE